MGLPSLRIQPSGLICHIWSLCARVRIQLLDLSVINGFSPEILLSSSICLRSGILVSGGVGGRDHCWDRRAVRQPLQQRNNSGGGPRSTSGVRPAGDLAKDRGPGPATRPGQEPADALRHRGSGRWISISRW